MNPPRAMSSHYMHWAKTNFLTAPRFSLTNSGVLSLPLSELDIALEDLELCGPSYHGYPPLQTALARHCGVPEECVVAATGTSMANYLVMAALLEPGDECLIEEPGYEPLAAAASHAGAAVTRFPRRAGEDFRIPLDDVRRALTPRTRLIVVRDLHNPSSARLDAATLHGLGELARDAHAQVLVDEVYLETLFVEPPPTAFRPDGPFVVTSSLTKAYGLSGLRCGWILARPDLARRLWRLNDLFGVIPAHPAERLSCAVLAQLGRVARRARTLLDANRRLLHEFLASRPELDGGRAAHGTVAFRACCPAMRTPSASGCGPRMKPA